MTRGCTIPQRIMTCPSENCSTLWLENDTGNIKPYLILRHFPYQLFLPKKLAPTSKHLYYKLTQLDICLC